MTRLALTSLCFCALMALSSPASAQCFADYKAKQDNPLRLHYGVMEITGACTMQMAQTELARRLAAQGWTLLTVLGLFGSDGLAERQASAGQYFLRF